MTQYYHKKGNRVYKWALLQLIQDIMWEKAVAVVHTDEGYDYEGDMIHFSSDGHKCILLGVGCPKVEEGIIPLKVLDLSLSEYKETPTGLKKVKGVPVDVNLEMQFLHIRTLERIANEVYDLLWDPEQDPDWEDIRDDYVTGFLDTYFYPEMKGYREAKQHRDLTYLGGKKWDDLSEHDKGVVADLEVDL